MLLAAPSLPPLWITIPFFVVLLAFVRFSQGREAGYWDRLLHNDWKARGVGLCSILLGLGAGAFLIYSPVREALSRNDTVPLHRGAVGLPAIFVFAGLILLLAGKHSSKFVITQHGQAQTPLQWATTLIGIAFCLALEFGFLEILREMGYGTHH